MSLPSDEHVTSHGLICHHHQQQQQRQQEELEQRKPRRRPEMGHQQEGRAATCCADNGPSPSLVSSSRFSNRSIWRLMRGQQRKSIMPKSARGRRHGASAHRLPPMILVIAIISISLTITTSRLARGQCLERMMTSFERIAGVTIKDAPLTILYQANMSQATIGHHNGSGSLSSSSSSSSSGASGNNMALSTTTLYQISTPITAECNNRCRRSKSCRAFLVDYSRHTCWSVDSHPQLQAQAGGGGGGSSSSSSQTQLAFSLLDRSPTPIHLVPTNERTAYFEKVCLNLPVVECERAWIFERVLAHHIHGHDDKIIDDVPSRLKCQEHCLNERQFRCRSGEYDHLTMQCRLSLVDRHLKPSLFRQTSNNIDYFENQCAPPANQCDSFDRYEDMDLGRAEIMRLANSSDQCQQMCTQTVKAFVCRSFTWSPLTGRCYLNSANTFMVGGIDKLLPAPGLVYYQRNDCIDLKLECDTNSMTLNLRTNEPFRGRMYVRDDPNACETLGRSALLSSLNIPFQSQLGARCAQREMPSRYSSVVVVQQHPLIQRKSDRYIKLVCDFQTSNKTITSHYNVMANPWTSTALINATSFAPKILLRITDKFGNDITGAKLGDELQLRIEAETDSVYDMVARSVLAKSGTTDESIVLIDRDGCPADFRIFPPLKKLNKRTIIGRFDAFKFSSDVVVRFQVDVQFCLNSCPPTNCLDQQNQLFNLNAQQLAAAQGASGGQSGGQPTSTSSGGGGSTNLDDGQQTSPASTTSSPSLATSGLRTNANELSPLGEYVRSTTYAPANTNRLDYVSTMNGADYAAGSQEGAMIMPGRQQQHQQQPPANQPLQSGGNGGGGQSPATDQLFDSAQPRSMVPNEASGKQHQQHFKQPNGLKQKASYDQPNPMHLQQVDQLSGPELAAALNQEAQQQNQNSHRSKRRRRRRSTEPLPASPKHVPLQREIIVIESPSEGAGNSKSTGGGGDNRQQRNILQTLPNGQQQQQQQQRNQRDMKAAKQAPARHRHEGNSIDGSKYELGGDLTNSASSSSSSQTADLDGTKTQLVCTTWTSLVFSMLAFGALQLLTLGVCLVGWLQKRRCLGANNKHGGHQQHNHHHNHHSHNSPRSSAASTPQLVSPAQRQQQQNFTGHPIQGAHIQAGAGRRLF